MAMLESLMRMRCHCHELHKTNQFLEMDKCVPAPWWTETVKEYWHWFFWALTDGRKKLLSHIFADFKSKFLTVNPSKVFMFHSMPCPTRPWKQMIQSWHRLRRLQVTSTGTLDGPKPPEATYGNMGLLEELVLLEQVGASKMMQNVLKNL